MNTDTEKTVVVFRKWKSGNREIIALFPGIDAGGGFCSSYEHIGQHGGAEYSGVIAATVPARPDEYADLKAELESIGYNLDVKKT